MKVIDLLNKIANGEEVPNEIKIKMSGGMVAPFYQQDFDYINKYTGQTLLEHLHEFDLNNEIIEEDKEIKEIDIDYFNEANITTKALLLYQKQCEIIDLLKELKKGKE